MGFVHVELKRDSWIQPEVIVQTPDEAVDVIQKLISDLDREMVVAIYMATSGRVIDVSICALGTIDGAMVSPSEIMRTALLTGCRSMILMHNHPSGEINPSTEDLAISRRICCAGDLIGIRLLDHIIIGNNKRKHSIKESHPEIFRARDTKSWDVIATEGEVKDEK